MSIPLFRRHKATSFLRCRLQQSSRPATNTIFGSKQASRKLGKPRSRTLCVNSFGLQPLQAFSLCGELIHAANSLTRRLSPTELDCRCKRVPLLMSAVSEEAVIFFCNHFSCVCRTCSAVNTSCEAITAPFVIYAGNRINWRTPSSRRFIRNGGVRELCYEMGRK